MFHKHVANLHQAGIVLLRAKTGACENKIMMVFVGLTVQKQHPKIALSQVCVAINAPVNAKSS